MERPGEILAVFLHAKNWIRLSKGPPGWGRCYKQYPKTAGSCDAHDPGLDRERSACPGVGQRLRRTLGYRFASNGSRPRTAKMEAGESSQVLDLVAEPELAGEVEEPDRTARKIVVL